MPADRPQAGEVSVAVPGTIPLPPPEGANFFHFTVVGQEIQFLVGSVNLIRLHEARIKGGKTEVIPEFTHRFLLSPLGFAALKAQIDQIAKSVPQPGVGIDAGATR